DDPELPADFQAMVPTLTEGSPTRTRALSADLFAAYTLLKDLTGKSSLALRVAAPRPIYQQGQLSQQYFFWAALAIALIFSLLVFLLMERSVLSRLSRLTNAVNEMAIGENSAADLIESGQAELADLARSGDEIGSLARAFSQLTDRTLSLITSLEQRVEARTAQLRAGTEVGRAAVSILDTDQLLREIVNLITDRFGFYYTAIFTLDETEHWAELREATGDAGRVLKERQHRLEVGGQSMVGTAIATRHMRIALDTGVEAVRFANPLLPGTRSEIALPLVVGDRVLGALDVQSTQAAAFDEANAAVLQTMADQLAIALSNAEQFKQTNATLQNTRNLFAASHDISTATDSDNLLRTLIGHITPDASRAGIVMFGPRDETGHPAYFEFVTTWVHADFAATTQTIQPGARFTSEQLPVVSSVTPARPLVMPDAGADAVPSGLRTFTHGFGAEAMIALALVAGHHPLGILIVGYRHTRTFNDDYLQTLVTLGGQAAVVLQNQLALAETQAALKQLDQANRRLTGEAWRAYAAALGGAVRVRDVVPGFQDETMPTTLDTPIVVRGEAIGTLSLEDAAPDRLWTPDEIALLQAVAGEVAVAVENARLIEQTERRAQREHIVAEISNE
ncbi:MAG: GAF domain-containing protein, partial [Chloroflexi bacterium]|nr:GAF domain-containing protein [Chloroflexota bacterium]